MTLLITLLLIINLLMVISFTGGFMFIFKDETSPKLRAKYAVFVVIVLALYLLFTALCAIGFAYKGIYKHIPALIVLFILPFIIGKFANYEKLRFYSFVQIFGFIIGLVYIAYLYFNFKHI